MIKRIRKWFKRFERCKHPENQWIFLAHMSETKRAYQCKACKSLFVTEKVITFIEPSEREE